MGKGLEGSNVIIHTDRGDGLLTGKRNDATERIQPYPVVIVPTICHHSKIHIPAPTPGPVDYSKPECKSKMGPKIRPMVSKRRNDPSTTPTTNEYCLLDTLNTRAIQMVPGEERDAVTRTRPILD